MENNRPSFFKSLSFKLIAMIIIVILLVEVIIYLPSVSNFRSNWLNDKLSSGAVAVRVLDVVPDVMDLPDGLADRLLDSAEVLAIVYRSKGQSQLIAHSKINMPTFVITADMRDQSPLTLILGTLDILFFGSNRVQRIIGIAEGQNNALIEVLVFEEPLRKEMLIYSRNIFILSLIVAFMTSAIIFIFINRVFITPISKMIENMIAFRQAPNEASLIMEESVRSDELGIAFRELKEMESDIFSMLKQRQHLADLGMAVAKINHDLRNMLTSVQLLSDQVANLDDPKVKHLAPRLVHSLDKAISFAQSVMEYGQQNSTPPKLQPVDLAVLVDEAASDVGLISHPAIIYENKVLDAINLMVDPEQMSRIMVNIIKNSVQALESSGVRTIKPKIIIEYENLGDNGLAIRISDNGPGLPPRAKENLFVAFEGSARAGGVGLGLTIARELCEAHGGKLEYIEQEKGTRFDICLPSSSLMS
jgi:signal transduction histidine kinase